MVLCTRACAKPQCKGGDTHRGTYAEQALSWAAGTASSGMDAASFASFAQTGFFPPKKAVAEAASLQSSALS